MRNKVVKKLMMIAMAVTMIPGHPLLLFMQMQIHLQRRQRHEVVAETSTESTEKIRRRKRIPGRVTGESDNSAFSTPGNAQLVDDKENDDTKQFLTIQTKKGKYILHGH